MAAKLQAELGLKLGNVTGAMNALTAKVKAGLAPLSRFQAAGKALQQSFAPVAQMANASAVGLAAAAVGAAAVGAGLKNAFDVGGNLNDLSAQTGVAIKDLAILQQAFDNAGIGAEKVGPSMAKMQKAISEAATGSESAQEKFSQIGLSMEQLKGKSATEQLKLVGDAINKLESPAQRTQAAMDVFGRSGASMLAMFSDSEALASAASMLGGQADLLQKNAAIFDRISDNLGSAGKKMQGFFVGMADQLAPVIDPLIQLFAETDFSAMGQSIGKGIAVAIQTLTDGSIWSIMADSAIIAVGNVINFAWKAVQGLLGAINTMLLQTVESALTMFKILTTPGFWASMGKQILSWVYRFNQLFYSVFAKVGEYLKPILDYVGMGDKAQGLTDNFTQLANEQGQAADQYANAATADMGPSAKAYTDQFSKNMEALGKGFSDGFENGTDAIDLSGVQSSMEGKIGEVFNKVEDNYNNADRKTPGRKKTGGEEAELQSKPKGEAWRISPLQAMPNGMNGMASSLGVFMKNILSNDPMYVESKRQTGLLDSINKNIANLKPSNAGNGTSPSTGMQFA